MLRKNRLLVVTTLKSQPRYPAPVYDSFDAPTGSINGRATPAGETAWTITPYTGSNVASLTVTTAGKLRGNQGTTPNGGFGYIQGTTSNRKWVTRRQTVAAGAGGATGYINADQITVGGATFSVLAWRPTAAVGVTNGIFWNCAVNGSTVTGVAVGTTMFFYDWDSITTRYYLSGANTVVDFYQNGKKIAGTLNVTTSFPTLPITYKYGYRGSLPATDGVDYFGVGDPDTDAMVSIFNYSRVLQRETDGDLIIRFLGEDTRRPAPLHNYTIYDNTGGDVVVKAADTIKSYVQNGDLTFTGLSDKFTPPSAGFAVEVTRLDVLRVAAGSSVRTGIQFPGDVFLFDGQSLITQLWNMLSGSTAAAPAVPSYAVIGTDGADAGVTWADPSVRYQHPIVATSALASFAAAYLIDDATCPALGFIKAGKGATTSAQRLPGTTICDNKKIGIKEGGMNFVMLIDSSGEYDLDLQTDTDNYTVNKQTTMDDLDAYVGHACVCMLVPLGSVWTATDARAESIRRQQYQLVATYPTRYKLGPPQADLQHTSGTGPQYHLTTDDVGYGRKATRLAKQANYIRGKLASPRTGPIILSAVKNSSSQITVTFDLNGATGLEIANSSYLGPSGMDFRGGLRFATDAVFTTPLLPTLGTINSVVGTTQSITYTFTGTPFTGTGYISGPYGKEPFNPTGDATIRTGVDTMQSMLRGIFSGTGESNLPVQPYYSAGGDYVTAS